MRFDICVLLKGEKNFLLYGIELWDLIT